MIDVLKYEHLRDVEKKYENDRLKLWKRMNVYHVADLVVYILLLLCCYGFNVVNLYTDEKWFFYSFTKSLIDLGIVSILKYIFTTVQHFRYAKINKMNKLNIYNIVSRHISGILFLLMILKLINFNYVKPLAGQVSIGNSNAGVVNTTGEKNNSFNSKTEIFIFTFRIIIVIYGCLTSVYFYFSQFAIFYSSKRFLIAKEKLKEHFETLLPGSGIKTRHQSTSDILSAEVDSGDKKAKKKVHGVKVGDTDKKIKGSENNVDMKTSIGEINNSNNDKNEKSNVYDNKDETDQESNNKKNEIRSDAPKKSQSNEEVNTYLLDCETLEREISFAEFRKMLLPYFWPSKRVDLKGNSFVLRMFVIIICICMVASKVFSILAPLFIGAASNEILKYNFEQAILYVIIYVSFAFLGRLMKEIYGIIYSQVEQSAFIELQESVFEKFHNLSYEWFSTKNAGSITRVVDRGTESANNLMNTLVVYIIPACLEGVVTCAIFVFKFQNSLLGSILYIGLVVYVYCTIKITKWRKRIRSKANRMDNLYHDISNDSLANYETVKYFNNEKYEIKRFCDALSRFNVYNLKIFNSLGILNAIQQFILNVTLFFTLYCTISMIMSGEADNGILVSVLVYVANVFVPLNILGTLYANVVRSFTDIKDLINTMREKTNVVDDSKFPPFMLTSHEKKFGVSVQLENVTFHYPSQPSNLSLKNVNIFIPAGTACAIVGHTGAGKTTISKLLYRFYDASGTIKIGGRDVTQYNRNSVRSIIGIVPQDTVLFNDTIRYNILYGKLDASEEELTKAVKSAQLYSFIQSLPKKWDTIVGDRGIKLSGGERQRIAIARCLLKDPKIVIFDEATSLLDSKTEYLFQKAVEDLKHNRTLIIIAHRLSTILTSEQVILLNKGEVCERGNHQSLLELNGEYAQLWNIQSTANKNRIIIKDYDRMGKKRKEKEQLKKMEESEQKKVEEKEETDKDSPSGEHFKGDNMDEGRERNRHNDEDQSQSRSEPRRCPFNR